MLVKRMACFGCIFMLATTLVAAPAFAADESNMAAKAATWAKEYNANNLKGVQALYATDGCRMPPNAAAAHGSAAILAQLQGSKEQAPKIKIALTSAETTGDQGYAIGTYEIMAADGSSMDHGKWMNVSKKAGGKWMIQCDIWNSDKPLPTAGK